jgi:Ca-activated chloride channel homolog
VILAFRFDAPEWLVLLVLPIALAVAYVVAQHRRPTFTARFTNLDLLASVVGKTAAWRRHVPPTLAVASLALLVLALARPVRDEEEVVQRATVILALDVSLSMQATDVEPSRIEAMRDAAVAFLADAPRGARIGLVSFAQTAIVEVNPTEDREALIRAVEDLDLRPGTAIGEAILASLSALDLGDAGVPSNGENGENGDGTVPATTLPEGEDPPARIVVMSDGTTTEGRPNEEGAAAATAAGIPVSTIAYGTLDGEVVVQDEVIPVPVDAPALEAIADATGGQFFEAASESELQQVFDDLGVSAQIESIVRQLFAWFVVPALVLATTAMLLSLLWFGRLV